MSRAKELEDATDCVWCAEQRRVNVEPPKIFERRPLQFVLDLPIAGTHRESCGEVRYHATTVVRNHEQARMALHVPGIDEA